LLLPVAASSCFAVVLEVYRYRRRLLPFPVYLLFVYAVQTIVCMVALHAERDPLTGDGIMETFQDVRTQPKIESMSIVMAAHNEHVYMERTLNSIYAATPHSIIKEIIVVDDGSDPPIAESLVNFPEVKVLRHTDRRGLIKSKTEGGNMATGDMIMFLDAHVKPDPNWSEPILRHMNMNYKRVVVPIIPVLNGETWVTNHDAVGIKMMFDWSLSFSWFEDYNDLVPCMSGGLFGITRQWWHESGEYDYGMRLWGSENIEQSIRVWLCGGEIFVARDSVVAHVFRSRFPYKMNSTELTINKVRTVEAWFDEYKERFYKMQPSAREFVVHMGDLSDRLALKQNLQCKPFKWYVEKFRNVFISKDMLPEELFVIKDKTTGLCVQSTENHRLMEGPCDSEKRSQHWALAFSGQGLRNVYASRCLDANAGMKNRVGSPPILYECMENSAMQAWKLEKGHLRWKDYCVQGHEDEPLVLAKCAGEFLETRGRFQRRPVAQTDH